MTAMVDDGEYALPDITDRVILSIHGAPQLLSNRHWKSKARYVPPKEPVDKRFKHSEAITFDESDAVPNASPHNDPLVISAKIGNATVHRIFVDDGSAVEILFADCFDKLGLKRESLTKPTSALVGFTGKSETPLGHIQLPVTIGEGNKTCTVMCDFVVLEGISPFNAIIGRPWMNIAKAIWSPYHLVMKFPTPYGVATVKGNQQSARMCMAIAMKPAGGFSQHEMVNVILTKVEGQTSANSSATRRMTKPTNPDGETLKCAMIEDSDVGKKSGTNSTQVSSDRKVTVNQIIGSHAVANRVGGLA